MKPTRGRFLFSDSCESSHAAQSAMNRDVVAILDSTLHLACHQSDIWSQCSLVAGEVASSQKGTREHFDAALLACLMLYLAVDH